MNNIMSILFFAFINHAMGAFIWYDHKSTEMMERCVKANPTMAVSEIKKYCEERLYYKSDK